MGAAARSWLRDLSSLYTPTATQFGGAAAHRASIRARLDTVFRVRQMFDIGSLRHGAGVRRYSDADYLTCWSNI